MAHLKNSRGVGLDGIPLLFYKNLQTPLLPILSKIFTDIANNCQIPQTWTTYVITPLYKRKGSRLETTNYRPIAVSSSIYKIFETCLYLILKDKLVSKIAEPQYGFMTKSSTYSNLIDTYYKVFKAVDAHESIDLITVDFCKAFDKVEVPLLIDKLLKFGVSFGLCKIIFTLLTNRHHIVKYQNNLSETLSVSNGLPQGSILGPLLFNVYLNDLLLKPLNNTLYAYADDLKLLGSPGPLLQTDLHEITVWSKTNFLPINTVKCELIHFGRQNPKISYEIDGVVFASCRWL